MIDALNLLQGHLQEDDELMTRVLNELREHHSEIEELEHVARLHVVSRQALASFITESIGLMGETGALPATATTYTYHQ